MIYKRNKPVTRMVCTLLCVVLTLCTLLPWAAAAQSETLKVAFCQLDGFFEYDSEGRESGYGVELLNKISEYTGIHFDYVPADSWEQTKTMVLSGQADIRMPGTLSVVPSAVLDYTSESVMNTYHAIMTLASRSDLYYKDYDHFSSLKIAMCDSLFSNTDVRDYLDDEGISEDNIIFFDRFEQCKAALEAGQVDAVISNIMDLTDGMKVLVRFDSTENYISMRKGDNDLKTIDSALYEIKMDNPSFLSEMYQKYYPERTEAPFTREEAEYITNAGVITVGLLNDTEPLSYVNSKTGEAAGIFADLCDLIAQKSGLEFRYSMIDPGVRAVDWLEGNDAKLVAGVMFSPVSHPSDKLAASDSAFPSSIVLVGREGESFSPDDEMTIAMPIGFIGGETYVKSRYPNADIKYYDTNQDCLEAIVYKKADVLLQNLYVVRDALQSPMFDSLNILPAYQLEENMRLVMLNSEDPLLMQILNKTIGLISDDELDDIIVSHTVAKPYKVTLKDTLYEYRAVLSIVGVLAVFAIGIVAAVLVSKQAKRSRVLEKLLRQSEVDEKTGLYNRQAFCRKTGELLRANPDTLYVLLRWDIDHFKVYNDVYGVAAGDEFLAHMGEATRAYADDTMVCGHWEADQFVTCMTKARFDADQVSKQLEEYPVGSDSDFSFVIRVGLYEISDPTIDVPLMCDRAFMALRSTKDSYSSRTAWYDDTMRSVLLDEQEILSGMNRAIAEKQFVVYLQPQYNHATGALVGAEALVRWLHPEKGLVPPYKFIPVFEKNGFIYELDKYVWERTCCIMRQWMDEGHSPVPVSVNVSRYDMFRADFTDTILGYVKKYDIPVDMLRLEITESAFSESPEQIVAVVKRLISCGFTVEIDDFGSGYSSLNTLKDVPAQVLKLDMKFFDKSGNSQRSGNIVESVVRMAKWLGMSVIAEGVETREQADYLKSIGCYYIQGYLYAKPMPEDEYRRLCEKAEKEPEFDRLETVENLDNNAFWDPKSMETLIFNSYVGGACIFESCNGKTELLRANDRYAQEFGKIAGAEEVAGMDPSRYLDADNKKIQLANIHRAIETGSESVCELKLHCAGDEHSQPEYIRVAVRVIAKSGAHYLFYCAVTNITQQRMAALKERSASERIKAIMDNTICGITAVVIHDDRQVEYIFVNDRFYQMLGYTKEQFHAEVSVPFDRILSEDYEETVARVVKLKTVGDGITLQMRAKCRDGHVICLRADIAIKKFDDVDMPVQLSSFTDITEQVAADESLRQLKNQLQVIMANINSGVSATVLDGMNKAQVVFANDCFYSLYGYTREQYETEVTNVLDLIYPPDREKAMATVEKAIRERGSATYEYRCVKRDGSIMWNRCSNSVVSMEGVGDTVLLGVLSDITELRQAENRDRENSEKLSAVLNHMGSGVSAVVINETGGRFLMANDKYYELLGYTRESYHAAVKDDYQNIHPEDREFVRRCITRTNETGKTTGGVFRAIRPDKSVIWLKTVISMCSFPGIEEPVQLAVYSDVTAEQETDEQLRFLNESAHDILAQPDSEQAINQALNKLLEYFGGNRAYVFEFDYKTETSSNTFEVCAGGVVAEKQELQNVPFSVLEFWLHAFDNRDYINIGDVDGLAADRPEKELLQKQKISSLAAVPLRREGRIIGFVGIDDPRRRQNQISGLAAVGDYVSVLLMRRDMKAKIESDRKYVLELMESTPGGFVRMQVMPDGVIVPVYCNDGFEKLIGMGRDKIREIYGQNVLNGVHPDDRDAVQRCVARIKNNIDAHSVKCRIRCSGGEYIWALVALRKTQSSTGETYISAYYSDTTEQHRAEQTQKELLDNLPCGASMLEYDGKTLTAVHMNRHYWELLDKKPVDYTNSSVLEGVYPEDRSIVLREIEAALRQNRDVVCDLRIRNGQNEYVPFHVIGRIMPTESDKHLIFAAFTPISDEAMSIQEMLPIALSTMMSAAEDASFVKDRDYRYICCSRSAAEQIGLASERDIIGKTNYELFDKPLADELIADDRQVLEEGMSIINKPCQIPGKNGKIYYTSMSKYPLRDPSGKVVGLYGINIDVTKTVETESRLKFLTDSISGGLASFEISKDGIKTLYYNDAFYGVGGYSRQEYQQISAEDPLALMFAQDRPKLSIIVRQAAAGKLEDGTRSFEYRYLTKSGGFRWMNLKCTSTKVGECRYVLNLVQMDITEQKKTEEELRLSEEEYRLATRHSKNTICRFDIATRTVTVNEETAERLDMPQRIEGVPYESVAQGRISADTAGAYIAFFEGIMKGEKEGSATFCKLLTSGWRWLAAQYSTLFDDSGKPVSAVLSYSDITEQIEKEAVYRKWQHSIHDRPESSFTLFRGNISRGASFDSVEGTLLETNCVKDKSLDFGGLVNAYARRFVHADDWQKYLDTLNSDKLLADYYRGNHNSSIEYREIVSEDAVRWLKCTAELVQRPNSDDVMAYVMYEDIDKRKKAELLTIERSETDPLTGILNRMTFAARTDKILETSQPEARHALLMLDVDEFKKINDTFGHEKGDQILIEVSETIASILRRNDLVGRLGGDEFMVFLNDIPDDKAAEDKARQLCEKLFRPLSKDVRLSCSVGIAQYPHDGKSFETLYVKADEAMYSVKQNGRANFALSGRHVE